MSNKAKIFGLGLSMAALMAGCGTNENSDSHDDKTEPKTEVVVKPQKTAEQIREEQKTMYYERAYDSVKTANGQKAIEERRYSHRGQYMDEEDIRTLKHPYSLGGVMENEVSTKGTKIIENSYQQIVDALGKYHVKLDNYIGQDSENPDYIVLKKRNSWDAVLSKYGLSFTGVDDRVNKDSEYEYYSDTESAWNDLVSAIYTAINESVCSDGEPYGDVQKNNMKATVDAIIEKTKKDLIKNRESVEQKYADYYLLQDKKYLGTSYWAEGDYGYGYDDLNGWQNNKYLIKYRKVNVYDSKLNVGFFGDKDATYKLVSLGSGKWQVVKTNKNGKTEKTPVFEDVKDFYEEYRYSDEPVKVGTSEFYFEAGRNMGVRIYWNEIVNVQQRKKGWAIQIPADVQHKIDSLETEIATKEQLYDLDMQKRHEADSIAKALTNQKFNLNER